MNSTSSISMIVRQVISDKKIRAIVDYPTARPNCTPTPNLCRDLPKVCSFMNEKAKVMAGFVPKPMKNNPKPMTLGESAIIVMTTEAIPMTHASLNAGFLPELSAILGIIKNPINAPKKSIDCSTGICS